MASVRTVLCLAALLNLYVSGVDFTNAFLNAPLDEDVYVSAPPSQPPLEHGYVYKLQRALYGLKQSPRAWNATLHLYLTSECGLKRLHSEHCLYMSKDMDSGSVVIICVYVDDLIIAYSDQQYFEKFIAVLTSKFKITPP